LFKVVEVGFRSFDEVELRGKLYLPSGVEGRAPAVCICHGIPVAPRQPDDRGYAELAEMFCGEGLAAFTFSFRGTGLSGGEFDLSAWPADLEAALDYLYNHEALDRGRLGVAGFSGGALAALYVAVRDPRVKALALCAAPADTSRMSLRDAEAVVAKAREAGSLRGIDKPNAAEKLKRDSALLNPINLIASLSCPLLILHGGSDELVDPRQAEELYRRAREPKRLEIVEGAPHQLRLHRGAMERLVAWFKELWGPKA
jgi:dipeptidyl aminopeptidase/acylaminoacyl peptidase